jgi:hypothetical protein
MDNLTHRQHCGAMVPARHPGGTAGSRRRRDRIRLVGVCLALCGLVLPAASALWKAPAGESAESRPTESYEERDCEVLAEACLRHGRQRLQRLPSGERLGPSRQPQQLLACSSACTPAHRHGHRRPDGSLAPLRL